MTFKIEDGAGLAAPSSTPEKAGSVGVRPLTSAALCMGYGGLELAIEQVIGATPAWCAEFDDAPSQVIEHHWPGLPNYRDITAIDWSSVPPVDIVTAGYPCQPFSHAGRREGTNDARHLWPYIAECLRVLRPRLAVFENVSGHLSLGLDTVLADLAALRFDAEWVVVRASDVGACHQRARLFIVAADAGSREPERRGGSVELGAPAPRAEGTPRERQRVRDAALDRRQAAADAGGERWDRRPPVEGDGRDPAERSEAGSDAGDGGAPSAAADTGDLGCEGAIALAWRDDSGSGAGPRWGEYGPAIARHAGVLGRPAPAPVDDRGRLSPHFVEWMQMLPAGHVTDVPDLSRAKLLKLLGNGVVPPQAAYAVRGLLNRLERGLVAA